MRIVDSPGLRVAGPPSLLRKEGFENSILFEAAFHIYPLVSQVNAAFDH